MTEAEKRKLEESGLLYPEAKETPMIPQHQAETTFMHLSWANRRMLIALICVCATFIATIIIFVNGYTTRERNWQETIKTMWQTSPNAEVTDGIYKQPSP